MAKRRWTWVLVAVLGAAVFGQVWAGPATQPAEALKPSNDIAGLPNFAKVSDTLYRGAQPTTEGFAALKKMGVKTVVSLRALHSDRDMLKGTGLGYVRIASVASDVDDEEMVEFLKVASDPANQPVFVHCLHGADRTGAAVAVYRITQQGWTADQAIAELPNFGFHTVFANVERYLRKLDPAKIKAKVEKAKMPEIDQAN